MTRLEPGRRLEPGTRDEPREQVVDLNVDAGEGYDDDALLRLATSANLACGGHAGTAESLRPVVGLAASLGVAIGAQVSYADRAGFGRVELDTEPVLLHRQLAQQLELLQGLCAEAGTAVSYVKPHGALYHRVLAGGGQADVVAALAADAGLPLLLMPGSAYPAVPEGFADRAYDDTPAGPRLRPRTAAGAVLTEPKAVAAQALSLAESGARSICVHGDTPAAAVLLAAVRAGLEGAGWRLRAFA